jgi:hypothetical protein
MWLATDIAAQRDWSNAFDGMLPKPIAVSPGPDAPASPGTPDVSTVASPSLTTFEGG